MIVRFALAVLLLLAFASIGSAEDNVGYKPARVVYDVSSPDPEALAHILDRASMLQNVYQNDSFEASIIFVIHEGAIPLFGNKDKNQHSKLMRRARSLSMGDIIQFRVCKASARMQGYEKEDIQEFASMVPMADAEIVMLQQKGYAYLR
ncbi:DsrE family protein [Kaarinaea lacus]